MHSQKEKKKQQGQSIPNVQEGGQNNFVLVKRGYVLPTYARKRFLFDECTCKTATASVLHQ